MNKNVFHATTIHEDIFFIYGFSPSNATFDCKMHDQGDSLRNKFTRYEYMHKASSSSHYLYTYKKNKHVLHIKPWKCTFNG